MQLNIFFFLWIFGMHVYTNRQDIVHQSNIYFTDNILNIVTEAPLEIYMFNFVYTYIIKKNTAYYIIKLNSYIVWDSCAQRQLEDNKIFHGLLISSGFYSLTMLLLDRQNCARVLKLLI